jgi:hypothetical protein
MRAIHAISAGRVGELYRKLALRYEPKRLQNERVLGRVRWVLFVAIGAGSVQLVYGRRWSIEASQVVIG